MKTTYSRIVAVLTIVSFSQAACYNTYFIDRGELEKLESTVEPQEVVVVYGDCSVNGVVEEPVEGEAHRSPYSSTHGTLWAQNEATTAPQEVASDASASEQPSPGRLGCATVPVSTGNPLEVVITTGEKRRVTPFNFVMSESQLVSPEYDLLLSIDQVQGAEIREFSTWKTIGAVAGVTAIAVGTFIAFSLFAPTSQGYGS